MRLPSQLQRSTLTSNKSLESAVWAEAHKPRAHPARERMRESRALRCRLDRKVARRYNRVGANLPRVFSRVRANHRAARTRSIRLDKPLRMQARVRFFVDHNKTCT